MHTWQHIRAQRINLSTATTEQALSLSSSPSSSSSASSSPTTSASTTTSSTTTGCVHDRFYASSFPVSIVRFRREGVFFVLRGGFAGYRNRRGVSCPLFFSCPPLKVSRRRRNLRGFRSFSLGCVVRRLVRFARRRLRAWRVRSEGGRRASLTFLV